VPIHPYSGAFVKAGEQQIHLMELPNPDPTSGRPQHGGRDRHLAFTIADIEPLIDRLKEKDVAYTMSMSGRRAVFCR
jgi:glyoxylase I family protein